MIGAPMVGGEWLKMVSWLFVGWLLEVIPDTNSGSNDCRCSSGFARVAWRYRENLPLCILSCPSLLGIWSVLPWLRLTYWYWFSLSERFAPRLSHSETCLVGPTESSCDLPQVTRVWSWLAVLKGGLPLINSVLNWFIRSLKTGFRYRFPWCDLRTLCRCWMTFLRDVPHD
jgi:hypothetical protein